VLIFILGLFIGCWAPVSGRRPIRLCVLLAEAARGGGSPFPIDPAQGGYIAVVVLTTLGSIVAAILPARAAARVDPVEVLNQ
jgi:lipoprotein-releasing system permease protein